MTLLMITRKVDYSDPLAGFIYTWVKKLGENVDELRVITWQEGDVEGLPENIHIFELPTKMNLLRKVARFKILVLKNIRAADGVFCHQMPEYTILAAPIAKLFGKKVVSWYTHKRVSFRMRLMTLLSDTIITASEKSFRLKSRKVKVVGHGIDTQRFKPLQIPNNKSQIPNSFKIISIGRISPTKDYESMIKAMQILRNGRVKDISLDIYGDVGLPRHRPYLESLTQMIGVMNLERQVFLKGPVPHGETPALLQNADLFINLSNTGSLDKAVLEAMASGCIVLTCNEAFANILPQELLVEKDNPRALAGKIEMVKELSGQEMKHMKEQLRIKVVDNHNLDTLVRKIVEEFK